VRTKQVGGHHYLTLRAAAAAGEGRVRAEGMKDKGMYSSNSSSEVKDTKTCAESEDIIAMLVSTGSASCS
jgi:hypothetical protein